MEGTDTMSLAEQQIFLSGAAFQVKIAASALRFARDLMTPEQAAKMPCDIDKEIAEGLELAARAKKMAEEMQDEMAGD